MAIIDQYRNILTVLIEFEVTPEECDQHVANIVEFLTSTVKQQPGFISANLHTSLDKTKVINYAQWKSEADYQAFLDNEEAQAAASKVLKFEPRVTWMKVAFAS